MLADSVRRSGTSTSCPAGGRRTPRARPDTSGTTTPRARRKPRTAARGFVVTSAPCGARGELRSAGLDLDLVGSALGGLLAALGGALGVGPGVLDLAHGSLGLVHRVAGLRVVTEVGDELLAAHDEVAVVGAGLVRELVELLTNGGTTGLGLLLRLRLGLLHRALDLLDPLRGGGGQVAELLDGEVGGTDVG